MSSRMDVSGGLAAPTAVLGALGGEVCQPKAGVQIYDEVTDSVIEAFIMMLMVGAVEEVVTIKEGVECRETCWGIPKGHGALTAHGGANVSWSRSGVGDLRGQPPVGQTISVVEQVQSSPGRLGAMETLGVFFICSSKELVISNVIEFNCSSLGLVQLKLQFIL